MGTIVYGGYYLWRLMSMVDIICDGHCLRWILSFAAIECVLVAIRECP